MQSDKMQPHTSQSCPALNPTSQKRSSTSEAKCNIASCFGKRKEESDAYVRKTTVEEISVSDETKDDLSKQSSEDVFLGKIQLLPAERETEVPAASSYQLVPYREPKENLRRVAEHMADPQKFRDYLKALHDISGELLRTFDDAMEQDPRTSVPEPEPVSDYAIVIYQRPLGFPNTPSVKSHIEIGGQSITTDISRQTHSEEINEARSKNPDDKSSSSDTSLEEKISRESIADSHMKVEPESQSASRDLSETKLVDLNSKMEIGVQVDHTSVPLSDSLWRAKEERATQTETPFSEKALEPTLAKATQTEPDFFPDMSDEKSIKIKADLKQEREERFTADISAQTETSSLSTAYDDKSKDIKKEAEQEQEEHPADVKSTQTEHILSSDDKANIRDKSIVAMTEPEQGQDEVLTGAEPEAEEDQTNHDPDDVSIATSVYSDEQLLLSDVLYIEKGVGTEQGPHQTDLDDPLEDRLCPNNGGYADCPFIQYPTHTCVDRSTSQPKQITKQQSGEIRQTRPFYNVLIAGLQFLKDILIGSRQSDSQVKVGNNQDLCLNCKKICSEESFPVRIMYAKPIGNRSLFVVWDNISLTDISGYKIFVDDILKCRLYTPLHDSAIVYGVDVNRKQQLTLCAVPNMNLYQTGLHISASQLSPPDQWAPSHYLYEPGFSQNGQCCCVKC